MHLAVAKLHVFHRRRVDAYQLHRELRQILRRAHAQHRRIKARVFVVFSIRVGAQQDALARLNIQLLKRLFADDGIRNVQHAARADKAIQREALQRLTVRHHMRRRIDVRAAVGAHRHLADLAHIPLLEAVHTMALKCRVAGINGHALIDFLRDVDNFHINFLRLDMLPQPPSIRS